MTLHTGTCEGCGHLNSVDLIHAPKFAHHAVRCAECGENCRVEARPLAADASDELAADLTASIGIRILRCVNCSIKVGYANLGNAQRIGKLACTEACARKYFVR